ncbi:MAG: hypothetical protein ACRECH_03475 [Nitrososphaerales archaeon]
MTSRRMKVIFVAKNDPRVQFQMMHMMGGGGGPRNVDLVYLVLVHNVVSQEMMQSYYQDAIRWGGSAPEARRDSPPPPSPEFTADVPTYIALTLKEYDAIGKPTIGDEIELTLNRAPASTTA